MSNFILGLIFGIVLVIGYSFWFVSRKLKLLTNSDYSNSGPFSTMDEKIHKSFVMIHNIEPHCLDMKSRLYEDMGMSKASLVLILGDLANQCNIKIDDSDVGKLVTVGDISDLLLKKHWSKSRCMLSDSRFTRLHPSSDLNVNLPHITVALIGESNESNLKLLASFQHDLNVTTNDNINSKKQAPNREVESAGVHTRFVSKRNQYTVLHALQQPNTSKKLIGSIMSSDALIIVVDVVIGFNARLMREALIFSKQSHMAPLIIYFDNVNQIDSKIRQEKMDWYENTLRQLLFGFGFSDHEYFFHNPYTYHKHSTQDLTSVLKLIDIMDVKCDSTVKKSLSDRVSPVRFYIHSFYFGKTKTIIHGIVNKGILKKKDKIKFISADGGVCDSRVESIKFCLHDVQCAYAGDYVSLSLSNVDKKYIRSDHLAYGDKEITLYDSFTAVIMMRKRKFSDYKLSAVSGKRYLIYVGSNRIYGTIFITNNVISFQEDIELECKIVLDTPILLCPDCENILIRDNNKTIATGRIIYE